MLDILISSGLYCASFCSRVLEFNNQPTRDQARLLEEKNLLEKKFAELTLEKERIEKSRQALAGADAMARFNRRVQEINLKIREFKQEERRFIAEMERHNAALQQPQNTP